MIVIKSPKKYNKVMDLPKIFLGGSIEMGTAENWQSRIEKDFHDYTLAMLNPRRDDWDSTWVQSINNPQFNEQVNWELDALCIADTIIFYFDPNTKSPITLMELGLMAASGSNIVVCCPQGFWRKGNVDIVCDRYDIPVFEKYEDMVDFLRIRYASARWH